MKVSLICPVYNEINSIKELIESMLNQSKKPDEIIFVDSFSNDGTAEVIKGYSKKNKLVNLIQKKSNIAQARNIAIKNARYAVIACTDASSKLDKFWLEKIIEPFKDKKIDVVSGGYIAISKGGIEDYISMITVKPIEEWKEKTFLPSGRSIAFRKEAWREVGGYPESEDKNQEAGEDTLFDLKLKEKGFNFKLQRNAIVYWRGRNTLKKFIKQFYRYGKGDKKMGNLKKMKKNLLLIIGFWIYILIGGMSIFWSQLIILLIIPLFFPIWKGIKLFIKNKKIGSLFWIPLLLIIKRISYVLGGTFG